MIDINDVFKISTPIEYAVGLGYQIECVFRNNSFFIYSFRYFERISWTYRFIFDDFGFSPAGDEGLEVLEG